jgi:hypothetical protein
LACLSVVVEEYQERAKNGFKLETEMPEPPVEIKIEPKIEPEEAGNRILLHST